MSQIAVARHRPRAAEMPTRKRGSLTRRQTIASYLLLAPSFLLFLTLPVFPLFYPGSLSLFRAPPVRAPASPGRGHYAPAPPDRQPPRRRRKRCPCDAGGGCAGEVDPIQHAN